ncbi:hypothetical protein B0T22DRAFT_444283 [Podospora appendiculata]|uniref:RRM domain-containing protein n=1 Tax=Podospora appendiculata TaxID=314037 RepID=A0AAE1C7S5_9PEZI|nr:hypothetical protein B0T22DRAFT_444283 [Podospora appendiculata]
MSRFTPLDPSTFVPLDTFTSPTSQPPPRPPTNRGSENAPQTSDPEPLNPQPIEPHENCAVFITKLPADIKYPELFSALAKFRLGAIFSAHILPPPSRHIQTAAAEVIFFAPAGAQTLLRVAAANVRGKNKNRRRPAGLGALLVREQNAQVQPSRQTVGAYTGPLPASRVVVVKGPEGVVGLENVKELLKFKLGRLDTVAASQVVSQGTVVVRLEFAGYEPAEAAKRAAEGAFGKQPRVSCVVYLHVREVAKARRWR